MRVHHLNAATMCPRGAALIAGKGGILSRARLVCHVLAIETGDGIVLVDTGLGLGDVRRPSRLGMAFNAVTAPKLDPAETAIAQLARLGFSADDVRHVVLTHLDLDHAGGLGDFPKARVHVHAREHEAAMARKDAAAKARYIPEQWAHGPDWKLYDGVGEDWFGFSGVRALHDAEGDILLVPLHGHTRGHCGVAVRSGDDWLLHAGDAYFHTASMTATPDIPVGLRLFQALTDTIGAERRRNQERLRQLALSGRGVKIFCAHDPSEFDACCASA